MLWTTAPAPSSSGRWLTGVANVLSTATRTSGPTAAISAGRSITLSVGFVGVSTHTSFVSGRSARFTASRSRWSTMSWTTPKRSMILSASRNVPP